MRRSGVAMISQSDVRKKLIAYLKDSISLADFEDWLVSESWNMHTDSDQVAIDLVDDIELALSEYSNKYLTLQELNKRLWRAASQVVTIANLDSVRSPYQVYKNANSSPQLLSLHALA